MASRSSRARKGCVASTLRRHSAASADQSPDVAGRMRRPNDPCCPSRMNRSPANRQARPPALYHGIVTTQGLPDGHTPRPPARKGRQPSSQAAGRRQRRNTLPALRSGTGHPPAHLRKNRQRPGNTGPGTGRQCPRPGAAWHAPPPRLTDARRADRLPAQRLSNCTSSGHRQRYCSARCGPRPCCAASAAIR